MRPHPQFLLVVLGALLAPTPARAEPPGQAAPAATRREVLRDEPAAGASRAREWQELLAEAAHGGGQDAVKRLVRLDLVTRSVEETRQILDAVADIGLRSEVARRLARSRATHADRNVRRSAVRALGRVGDGRDGELLLSALMSPDRGVACTALHAIGDMTGTCLPTSPVRVQAWVRCRQARCAPSLGAALVQLPRTLGDPVTLRRVRRQVHALGWLDILAVQAAAEAWIRAPDARLRTEGYELVAHYRLGDLTSSLRRTLRLPSAAQDEAARRAARALAIQTP